MSAQFFFFIINLKIGLIWNLCLNFGVYTFFIGYTAETVFGILISHASYASPRESV